MPKISIDAFFLLILHTKYVYKQNLKYMKKIFTLIAAVMFAACSYAQVNITDPEGKVYEDGSTMEIYDIFPEEEDFVMFEAPMLVNTSSSPVKVSLEVNLKELPEGTQFSNCFEGACTFVKGVGTFKTVTKEIAANGQMSTQIEWSCYDASNDVYAKGVCVADFTLYVNGVKDKTVTVRYVNGEAGSVNAITVDNAKRQGIFTLDGKRAAEDAKGLVIKNGKKVIVK